MPISLCEVCQVPFHYVMPVNPMANYTPPTLCVNHNVGLAPDPLATLGDNPYTDFGLTIGTKKSRYSDPFTKGGISKEALEMAKKIETDTIKDCKPGFKFGCDPELFVQDEKGRLVSAEGLLPGTKQEPHPVEFGAVQVDGMAAEFNIDPATSFEEWDRNISSVIKTLESMLPKGYTLLAKPSVIFDQEVWDSTPDIAKELGCMPDFNAWSMSVNPPPHFAGEPKLRTASGHIHIGWTEEADLEDRQHIMNCCDLVKQFDWYLGGWSLKEDTEPMRRLLYGKAGACRFKSYGVEYRVLSNFWVMDRKHRLSVWNRMQIAIDDMRNLVLSDNVTQQFNENLQRMINTSTSDPDMNKRFRYPIEILDRSYSNY